MTDSGSRWRKWVVCLLLGVVVLAVYAEALQCTFVNLDDGDYVTSNPDVQHGLSWHFVKWAFTTRHAANWHPLTWFSHMIDCSLYGLKPAGHHLTSLLLHLANSVLLFLLLNRMTGALWRSAWVAAIFALHPLRVESVVWVAERKDVLSTFFWMLTVGAYVRYADEFKVQSAFAKATLDKGSRFKVFYGLSLLFYAFGLMSKAMLVTLPFVLLLLAADRRKNSIPPAGGLRERHHFLSPIQLRRGGLVVHGLPGPTAGQCPCGLRALSGKDFLAIRTERVLRL
jgi:hypothetical protein